MTTHQPFRRLLSRIAMMLFMMMLTTMTAWAGTTTETRTVTFYLNGGTSGSTTLADGGWTLVSGGIRLHYNNNAPSSNTIFLFPDNNQTTLGSQILQCNGSFEFPNLEGTVKSVAFTNFILAYAGVQMYVGLNKNNNSTLLHLAGNATDYDFSGDSDFSLHSATFEGSQVVSASNPLKIMFSGTSEAVGYFTFVSGTIVITYDVEVEDTTDPGHSFTFAANASSDAIIATCTEGSGYHTCGLTNRQVTMPLVANNVPFDHYWHSASLDQTDFNNAGITDIGAILSYKDKSTNETLDNPPSAIGDYTATASVTVTYKETAHPFTLTKDFRIYNGVINCDYPQFSFSPKPAIADNDVTITFTPLAGEGIDMLTLTGDNTFMSLDNGITNNHDGTYTFTMVSESLTLDATFSEPDASHFEQTGENEYTIKTANGWGWFCFTVSYDLAPNGFSGKTVKLDTSVGSSEMAGTSGHPFKGTFDGQGNTLTFNLQASEGYSAPFHYTDGATISNLHVTGLIEGNNISPLAGLVGKATGNLTISNCHVSTQISTTYSGSAWHGGVIAEWKGSDVTCTVTGCVYDGLIYNPSEADATSYCSGFMGLNYGTNMSITFTDCLFAPAAYGTGKYALDDYCFTFVYPISNTTYNMTNCYYTTALGKRQGRPAVTATTAPANLGSLVTDRELVDGYQNGLLFYGKYYTPKYGNLAVEYSFDDILEQATTTINRTLYRDGDWNTLCLPFSQNAYEIANSSLNNAVIMELDGTTSNLDDEGLLTLYFIPATSIVAGRPYIVKWSYDDTANPLKPIFNPSDEFVAALGFISEVPTVDGGRTSNWGSNGSENYDKLVDGDTGTKYGLSNYDPYVEFHYQTAITPKGYALWTANDSEGMRNPKQWTIKAKKTSSADWTTLITVDNTDNDKLPKADNLRTVFALNNNEAYQYFRFEATRRSNSGQLQFQLAELQFCTVQPVETLLPHTDIVSPMFPVSEENINTEASAEVNFDGGQFVGTIHPVELPVNDKSNLFLGAANTLYWPNGSNAEPTDDYYHLGAYHAYFHIGDASNPNPAPVRAFVLNFGDGDHETGIINVSADLKNIKADGWYSLDGRKLNGKPTQRGIYINNGRKVVIK